MSDTTPLPTPPKDDTAETDGRGKPSATKPPVATPDGRGKPS